ncbi:unnamed protein product [Clonostachys rhizophaga]|uniref:Small ribosomal subunit protein uS9m n=1 Tax=Clonostachys rhizophaga TaxID=160324 RepID=A0A9N9YPA1_9HYPO|nr:unnamed protein product [Clonostachys rhizophaga]
MASLAGGLRHLRCHGQLVKPQWQQVLAVRPKIAPKMGMRQMTVESNGPTRSADAPTSTEPITLPFVGVHHARQVPTSPSYFTREPRFNDLYIRLTQLLNKYHRLPTLPANEAPTLPWMKVDQIRQQLGEPVKSSHFAKMIRVGKRLNLIDPSLRPNEIDIVLRQLTRNIDPYVNNIRPITIDKFGRAIGVGKRKESTARAFVVEGTGEVLVNGKPLNEIFGRVHDRESALWALTATQRMDKYNVWALVRGGGTTGQAEALTLAVAKALLVHEPALKPALRKAGCVTRDPRAVERKKHGRVKARKSPAWVKR